MLKNVITAIRTKQAIRGKSRKMNLVVINSIILGIVAYTNYPHYFFWIKILDFSAIKIMGLVIVSLACVLGISTLITMKDSWRVGIRPEQKTDLITNGFFKYSRNPFFLSFNLIFLGIFLEFPTLVYLIFYLSFIIILHLIIRDEEKHLMLQHGESYKNYKDSVNRYFSLQF
ncbi:MAG: isoprenylcysteine carboxylmethyltransferase family protein [Candidatus Cloacimonadales bacterium]|nr:isoprenylcysteine carboxylmethyltransferase family protein [Candidatus Cloacimonadales bacterium]